MKRQGFAGGSRERLQPGSAQHQLRRQGAATKRPSPAARSFEPSRWAEHQVPEVPVTRQATIKTEVGRRIMRGGRSWQGWGTLEKELGRYGNMGTATPVAKLIVPFVTAPEMDAMFTDMYDSVAVVDKARNNSIRGKLKRLNDRLMARANDERETERLYVFCEEADLYYRALNADLGSADEAARSERTSDEELGDRELKVWQPGRFAVNRIDSSEDPRALVVRFPDESGVLYKGRQDTLNDMSELGFNVGLVARERLPEAVIFLARQGLSTADMSFTLSSIPLEMGLRTTRGYEL